MRRCGLPPLPPTPQTNPPPMYTPAASSPASPLWGAQGGWPRGRAPLVIYLRVANSTIKQKKTWAKKNKKKTPPGLALGCGGAPLCPRRNLNFWCIRTPGVSWALEKFSPSLFWGSSGWPACLPASVGAQSCPWLGLGPPLGQYQAGDFR